MSFEFTATKAIPLIVEELQRTFEQGKTKSIQFRLDQIKLLAYMLEEQKEEFIQALASDLGRNTTEAIGFDIDPVIEECNFFVKKLKKLCKPNHVSAEFPFNLARPYIVKQPKGTILIIAPFNYPLRLLLLPLVGAIAAGNTVCLKPSEISANCTAVLTKWLPKYLDPSCYQIVNGAVEQATALLQQKFDHIFYTGSGGIAKIILRAAAEHLTPVSLELGGQCPVIVDETADLRLAARRITWGSLMNAGQTCVSPNHIFVVKQVHRALVSAIKDVIAEWYADKNASGSCKIITERHEQRLLGLVNKTNGKVLTGGSSEKGFMEPVLVDEVDMSDPLMQDEIFGPILPVLPVESVSEAISHINSRGAPLAIYIFSSNKQTQNHIINSTKSGAVNINDTVTQQAVPQLGFTGIGDSGNVTYTSGKTFDLFSYERAVMRVPNYLEHLIGVRYPPVTPFKIKVFKLMLQKKAGFSKPAGYKYASA